jgi:hypothetical protein
MKMKALLTGLVAASLLASAAIAAPPPGKGKPTTGLGCKPQITVVLKGTLVSASADLLTMNVTGANRWGRAYKNAAASVKLDDKTKVRGNGMKTVADLLAELKPLDRVLVQARVCKAELKDPTAKPELTASKVIGHPAKAASTETDATDD